MKVYTVNADYQFQSLNSDDDGIDFYERMSEFGKPLVDIQFPNFYIDNLKEKQGNFVSLAGKPLFFDQKALNALTPSIQLAGELFPVPVEERGNFTYCNLLEICDCLDEENSHAPIHPRTGTKSQIKQFAFRRSEIQSKSGLFRIPYGNSMKIFAVTDMPSRDDDFYSLYHAAGLTGLEFRLQWTDENK